MCVYKVMLNNIRDKMLLLERIDQSLVSNWFQIQMRKENDPKNR